VIYKGGRDEQKRAGIADLIDRIKRGDNIEDEVETATRDFGGTFLE
jgi:hypothetical protein